MTWIRDSITDLITDSTLRKYQIQSGLDSIIIAA